MLFALTSTPKPELSYEEHWLFDEVAQGEGNDGDGRVDAGETLSLPSSFATVGARPTIWLPRYRPLLVPSAADPYVTFGTASVNYGAVGLI